MRLDGVKGFVFDIDGTLIHRAGEEVHVMPGALAVLERVRASGRPFALFTNGSHLAPDGFARGLRDAGLPIEDGQVLTPLRSAIHYLARRHAGHLVRIFGTPAVEEYMAAAGVRIAAPEEARRADVVFVAHRHDVTLDELEEAARAVMAGARLLTGSYVAAYAGANGPIISRGGMIAAAIAKASSTRPTIVGKPSKAAVAVVRERLGVADRGRARRRRRPRHGHRPRPPRPLPHDPRPQRHQRRHRPGPHPQAPPPRPCHPRGGRAAAVL